MTVADAYSTVFAPELFVLAATLLLVGYEWRTNEWPLRTAAVRLGAVAAGWLVALAVYQGAPGLVPWPVPGGDDAYASAGLIAGFAVIRAAWARQGRGPVGPQYCSLLVATSVVHAVVVPVWNVSSHVLYAVVPALALAAVDRRFAVLLAVPAGMVWSRVATGAHSPVESVAGVLLGVAVVAAFARLSGLSAVRNH